MVGADARVTRIEFKMSAGGRLDGVIMYSSNMKVYLLESSVIPQTFRVIGLPEVSFPAAESSSAVRRRARGGDPISTPRQKSDTKEENGLRTV